LLHIQNLHHAPLFPGAVILDAVEAVIDVAGCAPEVANFSSPLPGLAAAPFADAEDDGTPGGVECIAHRQVRALRIQSLSVAPVVYVDGKVSGVLHGRDDHRVRGLAYQRLVDVTAELIPTVPTHRRRLRHLLKLLAVGVD